jgi:hypothetical protein
MRVGELQVFKRRMNLLDLDLVPFPRRLTPFYSPKGGLLYKGTKDRKIEVEREFLAPPVGVIRSVSRDRQLRQSESLGSHRPSPAL